MKRFSFPAASIVIALLVLAALPSEALKHNFYTKRDERSLIGPLGFPFGFLDTGAFNLTIFDFQLSAPKKPHKHGSSDSGSGSSRSMKTNADNDIDIDNSNSELVLSDVLDNIKGVGFLLKQFKDESSFNHYMAYIRDDPSRCIFQKYLDMEEFEPDIDFTNGGAYADPYDDDFIYESFDDDYGDYDDYYEGDFDDVYEGGYGVDDVYEGGYGVDDDGDGDYRSRQRQRHRRALSVQKKPRQQQEQEHRGKQDQQRKLDGGEEDQGYGEVIDAVEDGIYLDMLPRSHWRPHSPSVAYKFEPGQAGFYFLMYQVCYKVDEDDTTSTVTTKNKKGSNNHLHIHSRFELDFHFSNLDMFGHVSYLPRGEMILPWMFFFFSMVYAICLYVWYSNIKLIKEGKSGYFDIGDTPTIAAPTRPGAAATTPAATPTIYPIHYLMGFLLALKFSSLFFESVRYHYLRVTGHAVFFSAVYYTFAFLKGITLFTVILLIGSGWSFVKPFLSEREKKMIFGILTLQVINNIAIVVLTQETEGETSFDTWTAVLHLVDILCCCAVLIPIVWQVNQLEKNMENNQHKGNEDADGDENKGSGEEDSFVNNSRFLDDDDDHIPEDELEDVRIENGNDGNESIATAIPDARMAAKLKLFRSFYILVIAYIYMTRIVVYLFAATLNYKHTWLRIFVVELTTIIFYTAVGYMFRPMNENPYLHIRKRRRGSGEVAQVEMRKIDPSTKISLD